MHRLRFRGVGYTLTVHVRLSRLLGDRGGCMELVLLLCLVRHLGYVNQGSNHVACLAESPVYCPGCAGWWIRILPGDMCPSVWTRAVRDAVLLARVSPLKGRLASGADSLVVYGWGRAADLGKSALANPAAEVPLSPSLCHDPSRFSRRWRSDLIAPVEASVHILGQRASWRAWTGHRRRMR